MRNRKSFLIGLFTALIIAGLQTAALGQTANDAKLANVTGGGSSVRWAMAASHSGGTLTVSAPDGRIFRREFRGGAAPEFTLIDNQGERLPDGSYTYELRLAPTFLLGTETLKSGRARDDAPEAVRLERKRTVLPAALVQSGSFSILNGQVIVAGAVEDPRRTAKTTAQPRSAGVISGNTATRLRNHPFFLSAMPDNVIADDLIVQGSACVGLDCVNGESFGFDTIRSKENNDRLQFDDTSTAAGFPTNNWQIRANSSASGGASFLAFVDQGATNNSETGTIVFEVDAGAPANAVKVSSAGKVGFRTATPVLDLHITTSDTPAHRLEQTSAGGFTAQTWDIAGNEANFFVRDVTGGSRLPFRIRPGAPTSSIDIAASGQVGVGTASPGKGLDVVKSGADSSTNQAAVRIRTTGANGFGPGLYLDNSSMAGGRTWSIFASGASDLVGATGVFNIFDGTAGTARVTIDSTGRVGVATTAPTDTLSVNGTASKPGGGSWAVFSDERLKTIKGPFNSGLKAVMQLQPVRYQYKRNNPLGLKSEEEHVGFGAQALQKVIPEAVTRNANGFLQVNNDPILWTMLNAIQEQQKEIAELKAQVRRLQAASRRRR